MLKKNKATHEQLVEWGRQGGKMSGEHGIGYKKLEEFALCTPQAELNVIKAIKKALDPNNIMNPGKLVEIG